MNKERVHILIDYLVTSVMTIYIFVCWISLEVWQTWIPWGTVLIFFILAAYFFNHLNLWEQIKKRDYELYFVIAACLVSAINMYLVRSRVGAIFTITDLLLLLYLSNKMEFPKGCIKLITAVCMIILLFWIIFRHPTHDNPYSNPNGAACIIFTCAAVCLCNLHNLFTSLKVGTRKWYYLIGCALIILMIQGMTLKARGVMLGILATAIFFYILPKKKWTVYMALFFTLFFPIAYILAWKMGVNFRIPIINKQFLSGRERIWPQFFESFLQYPITGIGSDFERMVPTALCYEVHHGLLDILFVHGLPVFVFTVYLLLKRLVGLLKTERNKAFISITISVLLGMLVIGTFENYFITVPYNFLFFIIIVSANNKRDEREW